MYKYGYDFNAFTSYDFTKKLLNMYVDYTLK